MLVIVIVGAAVGVLVTVIVGAAVGVLDSVVVLDSVAGTVIAPALMPRMAVVAAVIVPMTVMVRMTAPAVVLLAQAADMLGILAALCHLLDHVGLHAIAAHGEHRAAQELVHARVAAQRADQPKIWKSRPASMRSATNMGSIASEVERNTATSVPSVTTRPA